MRSLGLLTLVSALVGSGLTPLSGHEAAVTGSMTRAARAWLDALSPDQRQQATYPFEGDERQDWGFVPRSRDGLPLKSLNPAQLAATHSLLRTVLSTRGFDQAQAIIALESVLRELEGASYRDPELYYVTIFGEPGVAPWGWRFEGHHLSLNVTLPDAEHVLITPNFFGANPARVLSGPSQGQRTLRDEEDLARALVQSFSEEQRRTAVISDRPPRDILTGSAPRVEPLSPTGLSVSEFTPAQRTQFEALFQVYLGRFQTEISSATRTRIAKDGVDGLYFAWAGGVQPGEGHYYRIQGETFVIEYDNTQNGANHVHTTFRDFERDFGRDLLREHYDRSHRPE